MILHYYPIDKGFTPFIIYYTHYHHLYLILCIEISEIRKKYELPKYLNE